MTFQHANDYTCYAQPDSAKYVDIDKLPIDGLEFESLPYTVTLRGKIYLVSQIVRILHF